MSKKRKCAYCGKEVDLPHVRVWEENVKVSRMLTFCNVPCMIKQYIGPSLSSELMRLNSIVSDDISPITGKEEKKIE